MRRDIFRSAHVAMAPGRPRAGRERRSGPAGFHSTSCHTSTIRQSTSSSPPTTGRRRPTIRFLWARMAGALPGPAHPRPHSSVGTARRPTPDDFARDARPTRCRCTRKTLLPLLLAHAASGCRPDRRRRWTMLRRMELRRIRRQRRRGDLRGMVPAARADACRRRDRSAACSRATWDASRTSRDSHRHARPRTTRLVRRCRTRRRRRPATKSVTARCAKAWRDLTAPARRRHDALALGRACIARYFRIRDSTPSRRCAAAQPLGAERRRLEHGERRAGRGGPPFEQRTVPGYREIIDLSPANDSRFIDARRAVRSSAVEALRRFSADWQAVRHRKMRMERADDRTRGTRAISRWHRCDDATAEIARGPWPRRRELYSSPSSAPVDVRTPGQIISTSAVRLNL